MGLRQAQPERELKKDHIQTPLSLSLSNAARNG